MSNVRHGDPSRYMYVKKGYIEGWHSNYGDTHRFYSVTYIEAIQRARDKFFEMSNDLGLFDNKDYHKNMDFINNKFKQSIKRTNEY